MEQYEIGELLDGLFAFINDWGANNDIDYEKYEAAWGILNELSSRLGEGGLNIL